eukprot:TRINITY_DN10960_c0_g1_i3.p1 TRINITY_DN10960_c0_g1~~TRINITY_DN10960_c0_g1_i3.p1  ORF type:complete len:333 (-),score=105.81 TRINITY_DN10960_c0_g1_i3:237-1235(-)
MSTRKRKVEAVITDLEEHMPKRHKSLVSFQGNLFVPLQMPNSPFYKFLLVHDASHNHVEEEEDKDHIQGKEVEDEDHVLIVTNLAVDTVEDDVASIFSIEGSPAVSVKLGTFEKSEKTKNVRDIFTSRGVPSYQQSQIQEEKKRRELERREMGHHLKSYGAGFAKLVFRDSETIQEFLQEVKYKDFEGKIETPKKRGLDKWLSDHVDKMKKNSQELQIEIDKYMNEFDRRELEYKTKIESLASVPDDDGWITVTKGGKNSSLSGHKVRPTAMNQMELLEMKAKQKKKKEFNDFYKFQRLEEKKRNLETLKERFEQDKKRVEKMRQNRKFRPI